MDTSLLNQQCMAPDDAVTAIRFPIRLLTVTLLLTIVTFAGCGWIVLKARRNVKVFTDRVSRVEELRGTIVNLDEVLTMSARMAAATGDSRWEERYRQFEPQLNAAIEETLHLANYPAGAGATTTMNEANLKLVEMENRAFALIRAGRREEARQALFSLEYETQKRLYAEGETALIIKIRQEFDDSFRNDQRVDLLVIVAALVVGVISVLAWFLAVRGVQRWHMTLEQSVSQRRQAEQALRQAHHELEVGVQQRTAELAATNNALQAENTERTRSEAALRESEERYRDLFDNAQDPVYTHDLTGRYTSVNRAAAELVGYTREELLDKNMMELIDPEYAERVRANLDQKLEGKGVTSYEVEVLAKNGRRIPVEVNTRLIYEKGVAVGVQGMARDITQRKLIEAEVKRARDAALASSRVKSEFLANMSHEIRTPMNGILGMTDLALDTVLDSEQRQYLDIVKSSAHSLLTIINDILDFSKIEAGMLDLEILDFSVQDTIAAATRTVVLRAHEKGLELAFEVSENVPDILLGDPGRLRQVVMNLIGNAVKFTSAGEILVRVESESRTNNEVILHFSVSDTGIGIPVDKQSLIFGAFAQADGSTTRRYGGTGLGLAICSQLVEIMSGRIWVESEEGLGSTFHFTVPFGLPAVPQVSADHQHVNLQGLRALIVDDNDTNRRILVAMLTRWQLQPEAVGSGAQALAALEHARQDDRAFSLVLLDACMPEMDGFAVAQQIRQRKENAATTIMMLTSIDQQMSLARMRTLGLNSYMVKPISRSDLFNAIQTAICSPGHEIDALPVAEPLQPAIPVKSLHFLLAEDNEVNQQLAVWILKKRGHTVTVVATGQEALDALAREQFDVVLMDVQMPEMNGFEATRIIRQNEQTTGGHVPIIAMTALAMKGDRERCLEAGMDEYCAKPIQPDQIFQTVAQLLNSDPDHSATQRSSLIAASSSATLDPAFDEGELLSRVEGSKELMDQLIAMFLEQYPVLLVEIGDAIDRRDSVLVNRLSHKIKGSAAIFAAPAVVQAAQRLEDMGHADDLSGAVVALVNLDRELNRLQEALNAGCLQTV